MSSVIPDFVNIVKHIQDIFAEAYKITGKRTKRPLKSVKLSTLSWGADHQNDFECLKDRVRKAVRLVFQISDGTFVYILKLVKWHGPG